MTAIPRAQRGLTLIELLFAVAIAALIMAALNSVVKLGLDAQSARRGANELSYQGRFALERMAAKARTVAPALLATPAAGTSGNWFAPAMYCLNAANQLIETTTADTGCTGTTVIAGKLSAFSAQAPQCVVVASPPSGICGPVDDPAATLSLTLADTAGNTTVTLATSIRLGGGTQ